MKEPREQPLLSFYIRSAWDTGEEDFEVGPSQEDAHRKYKEVVRQIAKEHQISEASAARYVTVHLMVKVDL